MHPVDKHSTGDPGPPARCAACKTAADAWELVAAVTETAVSDTGEANDVELLVLAVHHALCEEARHASPS